MENKLIKSLIVVGVPGVALGVFYLLLKSLNFEFSKIDPTWSAIIVVIFLLVVGGVTVFALHRWSQNDKTSVSDKNTVKSSEPQSITISTQKTITCSHCGYGYAINNLLGKSEAYIGATTTCPKCGNVEKIKNNIFGF